MNAANVRSATVRLNAEVAKYIADIKAAGKATEDSFDRAHGSIGRVNDDLVTTNKHLREYRTKSEQAARNTDRLATSMGKLNTTTKLTAPAMADVDKSSTRLGTTLDRTGNAIDRTSGRLALFAKLGASFGPSLIPFGAVGIAGIAGLASQLGFAATGITSLVVASQGLGTALKAVETARLEPTVANLQAARDAMDQLGPQAQTFVRRLQELRPVFAGIRNQAAAGWFPGLTEALDHFDDVAPRVGDIFQAIGETGGDLVADAAEALAGPEWADFLSFIQTEAPAALDDLGRTTGNLITGLADLWMAFTPVNNDFSDWLLDLSRSFEDWSSNLSQTQGFQDFVAYLRENGPLVADAGESIANALIQIVQAAAPLGGPTLRIITALADAIAAIADSPLGTPLLGVASALSAISLATRGLGGLAGVVTNMERLGPAATKAQTGLAGIATKAGPLLAASAAIVALGNALGDAFGAKLELSDVDRDLQAIANGSTSDALSRIVDDLALVNDRIPVAGEVFEGLNEAITLGGLFGNTGLDNAVDNLDAVDQALAGLVESGNADQARDILENIGAALIGLPAGASISESVWNELLGNFDAYSTAVDNAGGANGIYSESLRDVGDAAGLTRGQIRGMTEAMLENANAAIGAFDAVTAYREALKAARIQGEKNDAGIQGNSKAALENRNLITGLASAWNNQSAAVRNNVDKYREARRSFIDVAEAMGIPIERAIKLADAMLGIPRKTTVALEVDDRATAKIVGVQRLIDYYGLTKAAAQALLRDLASGKINTVQQLVNTYGLTRAEAKALLADAASGKLQGILNLLSSVDGKTANTYVVTHLRTVRDGNDTAGGPPALRGADGMTVPGPRQPYGDKTLIFAAPGEEVISNRHGQADRFRADQAAGRIPRYAEGGTIDGPRIFTRGGNNQADEEVRRETEHRKRLNAQLKEATKVVEEEHRQRDRLVDRMDQIRSGLSSGLTTDLGADSSSDVWAGGATGGTLSGNLAIIRGDTAEAARVRRLIRILRDKGFDGAALEDLLARGDVNEIASYASGSRGQLRRFERAFTQRAQLVKATTGLGADAALGDRLDTQIEELRDAKRELRQIKAEIKRNGDRNHGDHKDDRQAQRRGAGNGRRNQRRD